MKLRKILAGFLAGAVAMGSMVFTASAAGDVTLGAPNNGWGASYDADTKAITYTGAWSGYGWWIDSDYSDYDEIVIEYSSSEIGTVKLVVEYSDDSSSDATSTDTDGTITVEFDDEKKASVKQIYIQNESVGSITLDSATVKASAEDPGTPDVPAATDPYIYTYDGSPVELTVAAADWAPNGFAAQNNMALSPTGFTAQTTTFAELKELYSGITVKDWAITNVPDGIVADNIAVSIYVQYKSDWSGWAATDGTSVTFADLTAIADTDPIMAIGFQLNYNLSADDVKTYAAGDKITVNGAEEEPTPDTPAEEEGFDQTKADVEAAAENGTVLMQTATFGDVEAVRFTKVVSLEEIKKAAKVVFTFETNDGRTGTYESTNYYTSLMASGAKVDAPENYGFLSLTVTDIPDGVTLTCTKIELHTAN